MAEWKNDEERSRQGDVEKENQQEEESGKSTEEGELMMCQKEVSGEGGETVVDKEHQNDKNEESKDGGDEAIEEHLVVEKLVVKYEEPKECLEFGDSKEEKNEKLEIKVKLQGECDNKQCQLDPWAKEVKENEVDKLQCEFEQCSSMDDLLLGEDPSKVGKMG